jgi:hypothetical protein
MLDPNAVNAVSAIIAQQTNSAVRDAALRVLEVAKSTDNPALLSSITDVLDKSAKVDGKTAIFFSGDDGKNQKLAADCRDQFSNNTYLFDDTPAARPQSVPPARISLGETRMQIENKLVDLAPGMAVTVEIKTGQRRIIEYLLSPLLRYKQESLRER